MGRPDSSLVFGRRPVVELLRSGQPINRLYVLAGGEGIPKELFQLAKERSIPTVRCDRKRLDNLVRKGNHQGVVAQGATREFNSWQEILEATVSNPSPPFLLVLDGVQDPGNFGALLRTAEAAGVDGVLISSRGSCGLTPAVSRAAAGADLHVRIARADRLDRSLKDLVGFGYQVVAAMPDDSVPYFEEDYRRATALVLGGEGEGVTRQVAKVCSRSVRIPLRGKVDSLNVSAAGAVLLYEVVRQRDGE